MAAIELNLNPTDKQLRQFGLIGLCALPIIGWLFSGKPTAVWEPFHLQRIAIFAGVGVAMGLAGFIHPRLLKWLFVGASIITFPIGFVLGEVIMFTIYVTAFVPMALLFRLIGRDALERGIDREAKSYWQSKPQPKNAASYYRQS